MRVAHEVVRSKPSTFPRGLTLGKLLGKALLHQLRVAPNTNQQPPPAHDIKQIFAAKSSYTSPSRFLWSDKMESSVEIITTPTSDTPGTAILLSFNDKRYLIGNIHEGLTRATIQRGLRLAKVSDIFVTGRTEWRNIGGLLGIVISLAEVLASSAAAAAVTAEERATAGLRAGGTTVDRNKLRSQAFLEKIAEGRRGPALGGASTTPKLVIHGGPNLTHSLASARRFVFRRGMPIRVDEFLESERRQQPDGEWKPDWVDERIQVWTMGIVPAENGEADSLLGSESPLKRTYAEFAEEKPDVSTKTKMGSDLASADSSVYHQNVRASVVSHMFDSTWRPDNLEEVLLADVQMPAQIFTRDPVTQKLQPYDGPLPDGTNPPPPVNVLIRKPWPAALVTELPHTKPSKVVMSYIFRNHPQRGKFQNEVATKLNIPPPLRSVLAEGNSVQYFDGTTMTTVTPDMVLLPGRPGNGFAVVDLPSQEYVHNLVERPEWQASKVMSGVEMIIWILGPGVGQNEELRKFMNHHGQLRHIISSQDYCSNYIAFDSSASGAVRLNQIDPDRYIIPVHTNNSPPRPSPLNQKGTLNVDLIPAKRGLKLQLESSVSFNKDQFVPPLDTTKILHGASPHVKNLALAAKASISSESVQEEYRSQDLPSPDAEIVCLGTGSASPSKYRNVSSTLLRVPGSGSYLLDCGENTLGQLKRIYQPEQLRELLRDLKLIWISHLHADHHLGLISVIKAWYEEVHGGKAGHSQEPRTLVSEEETDLASRIPDKDSLVVVCSGLLAQFLREQSEVDDFGFHYLTWLCPRGGGEGDPRSVLYYRDRKVGFESVSNNM